jgi:hypothetical protein
MGEEERWARGAGAARKIDGLSERIDNWSARQDPLPELRQRVLALAQHQWGSPVEVVHLGDDVKPAFEVPGRRADGTVKGKRLVRRFFWNILRGVVIAVVNVVALFNGGGAGNVFAGRGRVTGPADAQAIPFVAAARSARRAWLVHSATHVGVIDSGGIANDTPPVFVWQARTPDAPEVNPRRSRLTWPDGSVFEYGPISRPG